MSRYNFLIRDHVFSLFSNYKSFCDVPATSCTTVTVHVHKQTPFSAETPALLLSRKEAQFPKRAVTACHSSHTHCMKQSSSQASLSSHAQNSPVTVDPTSPVARAPTHQLLRTTPTQNHGQEHIDRHQESQSLR